MLLAGVNTYRASLNLSSLTKDENAECLADRIADQFNDRLCTNTTGSNAALGAVNQFSNYPQFLSQCRLNISNAGDGIILPVCVRGLRSDVVLSNFTRSQYSRYLNDSRYVGAGIATEDDWIVMVLTTNSLPSPPSGE